MTTKTPGYSRRLEIFFATDCNGKRRAYRWAPMQMRSFPVSVAAAEMWIAQDLADQIPGNPLRPAGW